jgi:excisionase family DNA binding protein
MGKLGKRGVNPGGILSTQEVATVLQISHPTLLRLLKEKKIPEPQRVSGVRYWNRSDVRQAMLAVEELKAQKGSRKKWKKA